MPTSAARAHSCGSGLRIGLVAARIANSCSKNIEVVDDTSNPTKYPTRANCRR